MSGFVLRVIAMITMVTDHIGWTFLENPMHLTWIGRIAFPIYAFLLAEGFRFVHSDRDRLTKHLSIMLILAVVAEPGFDLMDMGLDYASYLGSQSNMITLLFGYLGMLLTEALVPSGQAGRERVPGMRIAALFCGYGLLGFANYMLHGNFNIVGPWLVIAFYWYIRVSGKAGREGHPWAWGKRFLVILSGFAVYLVIYFWVRSGFGDFARWQQEVVKYAPWIAGHIIAVFIISLYNGELGYHKKWFSRLYTWFYPAHMYVIGIVSILLGRA